MDIEKRQPIQVVDRALDLLELLASENEPVSTTNSLRASIVGFRSAVIST